MGISDATYYNWKSKYHDMEASDAKRLRELEDENQRLKQMYTDLSLVNLLIGCSKILLKKALNPTELRSPMNYMKESFSVSLRRACRVVGISDSVYRYIARPEP